MHGCACVFVCDRMFPCTAGVNAAKWSENSTRCTRTWSRCRTVKARNPSTGHEGASPKRRELLQVHTALYESVSDVNGLLRLLGNRRPSPYIVSFYDAFVDRAKNCMCLVMEYMSTGSLQDIVLRGGCQNEKILARLATGVLRGLAHIHRKRMVHRDIKPHNLLTNRQGEVKISDFGLARTLNDNSSSAKTFVGTLLYMAPERIGGGDYSYPGMRPSSLGYYSLNTGSNARSPRCRHCLGMAADVWSCGLALLSVALGRYPLPTQDGFFGLVDSVSCL